MKPFLIIILIAVFYNAAAQKTDSLNSTSSIIVPDTGYVKVYGKNSGQDSDNSFIKDPISGAKFGTRLQKTTIDRNRGLFIEKKTTGLKSTVPADPRERLMSFMEEVVQETGIENPRQNLRITRTHTDNLGYTHLKVIRQYGGIDIYGSEASFHYHESGDRFIGKTIPFKRGVSTVPWVTAEEALETAQKDLEDIKKIHLRKPDLYELRKTDESCKLIFFPVKDEIKLAWEIDIYSDIVNEWKYFISASDGTVLFKYYNTKTDGPVVATGIDLNNMTRNFNVYLSEGIYYMYDITQKMFNPTTNEGIIITLDANSTSTSNLDYSYVTSTDNTWTQKTTVSAHCNAIKTFQYFHTTFNWNSVNGKGCNIISLVNIVEEDGSSMENAFWNGQAVFYGNGGTNLKPLAGALDVTAHEISHGVIASTANLAYYGQSGAINESFADIFACMIDRSDWTIGEDITLEGYSPSGAIRDLSNPHNMGDSSKSYWQPSHSSEMYNGTDDNGGIHRNSGICNYVFYLYASRIGKSNAEKVYFRALNEYLTKTSDFIDLRIAIVQSARDLFGDGSSEVYEAGHAFETAGIYEETPPDKTGEFMINPGKQMLLTFDTNPNDPVTVYVSTAAGTGYRPLTNTPMKGKVSVTDNGETGVFVSNDRRLRMINVTSPEINERIISGYSFYENVAISKDGNRIAATKGWADGSIYVIDLVTGGARQYLLYNPTTSSTVDAGGVVKAYAIEFDVTGEYIIYDAYNVINSNSQKDIYYWDIGIIKVWDHKTDSFGDGSISKLFTSLPMHVNVANPTFARNSPYIIAFDYFYDDGILEEYGLYAANLETGEMNLLSANDRLGYPSFSTNDDKLAYSTINGLNTQVVKAIKLEPDKITPTGDQGVLVPDAKWPVFFATGTRPLGLAPVSHFTCSYKYGDYPLTVNFTDLSLHNPLSWHWFFEGGTPAESLDPYPQVFFENPGKYDVILITQNEFGYDTLRHENYIHVIDPVSTQKYGILPFSLSPNPVTNILNITCGEDFGFRILDLQGNEVITGENKNMLDLSGLPSGLYIFEMVKGAELYFEKLIKQ